MHELHLIYFVITTYLSSKLIFQIVTNENKINYILQQVKSIEKQQLSPIFKFLFTDLKNIRFWDQLKRAETAHDVFIQSQEYVATIVFSSTHTKSAEI